MSAGGDRKRDDDDGRRRLLPELLPAPSPVAGALTPPERVAERARLFLQRFRGLGAAAGAAVLTIQCGYGVVDPLPPPPPQCSASPDPFTALHAKGSLGTRQGDVPTIVLEIRTDGYGPRNTVGFRIDAVRVTGGTVLKTEDLSQRGAGGFTSLVMTLLPESASITMMVVDVDLGCSTAGVTKSYQVRWEADAVFVVEATAPTDGGTSGGG